MITININNQFIHTVCLKYYYYAQCQCQWGHKDKDEPDLNSLHPQESYNEG